MQEVSQICCKVAVVEIWELRDIFKSILSKEVKNISATVWEPLSTFSQNVTKNRYNMKNLAEIKNNLKFLPLSVRSGPVH